MKLEEILAIPGTSIKVAIKEQTPHGEFNDAIFYQPSELASLTAEDVEAQKKQRSNNWVQFVTEASIRPAVKPTKEELLEHETRLVEQVEAATTSILNRVGEFSKADLQSIQVKIQVKLDKLNEEIAKK